MRKLALLAAAGVLAGSVAVARPVTFEFPEETFPPALADDASQVVVANCSGCHSLDYLTTQPRHKGAQFWRDEVAKMVNVYKAPIEPSDAETVARVLADKFG